MRKMLRIIRNYLLRIYSYCSLIQQGFTFCERIGSDVFVDDDFAPWTMSLPELSRGEQQCRSRIGPYPLPQEMTGDLASHDVVSSSALTTARPIPTR